MKYIGNKTRLLDFINESIIKAKLPQNGIFIDIFGGTGSVGKYFKNKKYKVIANDFMTYSYIAQYVLIKINQIPSFNKISKNGISGVLQELNSISPKNGYVFNNFAPSGKEKRQYFSDDNARKIDAIRDRIEKWRNDKLLSDDEYYILVYSLIDAADFVANISGTYGAYLKIWRSMALKKLELKIPDITNNKLKNEVFQEDANLLIKKISGDILYLDPPYNERQYASNFHLLETLAVWDKQDLVGKTGQRDYSKKKSAYSQKVNSIKAFEDLIINANTRYIILSYNNEGIIPRDEILRILNNKGKVTEYTTNYRRFRTERDHDKRQYKKCDDEVVEHLYIIKID